MKHIYVYTSDLGNIKTLKSDDDFKIVPDYPAWDYHETFRNEYGRFKTESSYIHILTGKMPQDNCPWCGHSVEVKKVESGKPPFEQSKYCAACINCGSQGPLLNIMPYCEQDESLMAEFKNFILKRYKDVLPWDHNFKNPHDENE